MGPVGCWCINKVKMKGLIIIIQQNTEITFNIKFILIYMKDGNMLSVRIGPVWITSLLPFHMINRNVTKLSGLLVMNSKVEDLVFWWEIYILNKRRRGGRIRKGNFTCKRKRRKDKCMIWLPNSLRFPTLLVSQLDPALVAADYLNQVCGVSQNMDPPG